MKNTNEISDDPASGNSLPAPSIPKKDEEKLISLSYSSSHSVSSTSSSSSSLSSFMNAAMPPVTQATTTVDPTPELLDFTIDLGSQKPATVHPIDDFSLFDLDFKMTQSESLTVSANQAASQIKTSFDQSVIDDFDPILTRNQTTESKSQNETRMANILIPNPVYQNQSSITAQNQATVAYKPPARQINPFMPTPFYGYNQQVMHHSVTYPIMTKNDSSLKVAPSNTASSLFEKK